MSLKRYQHGGNLELEAKRLGFIPSQVLDASASIVPFSPPLIIIKSIEKSLKSRVISSYPDRSHYALKTSIAAWHNIDPDMILPGNGASELITWAAREASSIGTSAIPAPCFSDYERALKCWEGKFNYAALQLSWHDQIPQAFPINSAAKVIWITNPHNPTGQLWDKKSLEALLEKHELVICDEAFLPLTPNGELQSLVPLVNQYQNLIVIRSLTKLFAIAGLRLGYVVGSESRLKKWEKWRDPWPINGLAIEAGKALFNNQEKSKKWIKKIHNWINIERPWLSKHLGSLNGIKAHPTSTNFQLIESKYPLTQIREKLEHQKILLRDCQSFKNLNSNWLRISLQKRSDNKKIFMSLKRIIEDN